MANPVRPCRCSNERPKNGILFVYSRLMTKLLMRKIVALIYGLVGTLLLVHGQQLPFREESAFQAGEELTYRLRYGIISAAIGTLKVDDSAIKFSSPHSFHLSASGRTSAAFSV